MKTIEDSAFRQCESLEAVSLSSALEKIGLFAFHKTRLETVRFPGSLRTVAQGAFAECACLRAAEFCEGLKALGTDECPTLDGKQMSGVFEKSALESVKLPSTLKRIECKAFK